MDNFSFTRSPDTPRQAEEKKLANGFLSILQRHHRDIRRASVGQDEGGITVAERKILTRTTYQNWTLGLAAGAATFGVLMGVTLRSAAAAKRYALPKRAPSAFRDLDKSSSTKVKGKRQLYHRRNEAEDLKVGEPNEGMDPTSLNGEVMSQGMQSIDMRVLYHEEASALPANTLMVSFTDQMTFTQFS